MMSQNKDSILWKAFISGEERTFDALYERYTDILFAFGIRYTTEHDLVKDAIHDLFVDLHRYRTKLAADVNVKGYLFASLKRKIVSALKKKSNNSAFDGTDLSFLICHSTEDIMISDESQKELHARLKSELSQLPARQQEVMYLRFNSELEYEQISELMDVSVGTCRTLVYRAVKQLREKISNTAVCYILMMFFSQSKFAF